MRTETAGPGDPKTEGLEQTLVDLARAFVSLGEEIAALGGVTPQQWAILHQVGAAGDAGISPSDLATLNGTSRANITKLVARLGRIGQVAALPSPVDGRQKRLALTVAGQRALLRMNGEKAYRLARALEAFSTKERAELGQLAGTLLRDLGAGRPRGRPTAARGGRPPLRRA